MAIASVAIPLVQEIHQPLFGSPMMLMYQTLERTSQVEQCALQAGLLLVDLAYGQFCSALMS